MDISGFSRLSNKSNATIKSWLKKGIVPGARLINHTWFFSEYAMPPYTAGRPQRGNATSIRKTIIKAALLHKSTSAQLFGIPDHVFDLYTSDLEANGLIRILTDPLFPGDKFIFTTLKTDEFLKDHGLLGKDGLITTIASKAIEGAVSALIKSAIEG